MSPPRKTGRLDPAPEPLTALVPVVVSEVEEPGGVGPEAPPQPPAAGSARVSALRGHLRRPRAPPAREGGVHETPTGLQRALPNHRREGAQALRGAGRQAEGVLRVGLEVVHHECRGRVEGPPDLGARAGEAEGDAEGDRDRDRERQVRRR